jgi:hypothetical protein
MNADVLAFELSPWPIEFAAGDAVLESRQRGLRRKRLLARSTRVLHHQVMTKQVGVEAVLVAQRDRKHALAKLLVAVVAAPARIAAVIELRCERTRQAELVVHLAQQQRPTVR